ncbi:MAG TPA: hypothetical protein VJ144_10865, partial [Candidatus Polarisedimenticolia bacterium]|nr:hypothetical protein [Candidatus Polarisedimenticolia bacterium]
SVPANREARTESDLLKAADTALYRAKQASRNKVIVDRASMPTDILEGDLSSIFQASYEDTLAKTPEDDTSSS